MSKEGKNKKTVKASSAVSLKGLANKVVGKFAESLKGHNFKDNEKNGTILTYKRTRSLEPPLRRLKMLLCYNIFRL